jgi:hypothetical protein
VTVNIESTEAMQAEEDRDVALAGGNADVAEQFQMLRKCSRIMASISESFSTRKSGNWVCHSIRNSLIGLRSGLSQ